MNPYYQNYYYQNSYNQNKKLQIFIFIIVIFSLIAFLYLNPEYLEKLNLSNNTVNTMNYSIKTFEDCHEKLYEIMDENDKKCNTNNEANNEVDLSGVAKYLCIHPDKIPENYLKTGGDLKPFWSDDRIEPMNAYYNYAKCRNETNGCEKSVKIENDECAKTHNILEYKDQVCIIQ